MRILWIALLAVVTLMASGCASQALTRSVQHTHWLDEDRVLFIYERDPSPGGLNSIFRPAPTTTHVLLCHIREDNLITCEDQRQITNLLNPHADDRVNLEDRWTRH